jgi:iron(III) transport system permease protein
VVLLVGTGLRWVERELEEDALTATSPWRVLVQVTLPRSQVALAAAALWVALQTATEITVTDMMQVRTFAEEVYSQFVRPEPDSPDATPQQVLARAIVVALPIVLLTWALVTWAVARWERQLPPPGTVTNRPLVFRLGWARWPCLLVVLLVVAVLLLVPLGSLVWKAGLAGSPQTWSARTVQDGMVKVLQAQRGMLLESGGAAALAGVGASALGLVTCWLAVERRWFRLVLLGLVAAAWAIPGPVAGIGLKEAINGLLAVEEAAGQFLGWEKLNPLRASLYDGPSLLPVLWAYLIRFFPFAVALLWPVVRSLPVELREAARVDGARPAQELALVVWPLIQASYWRAALAVAVLTLGELSASKLVATPGSQIFSHEVFTRMHFGVTSDLAALCLVLLAVVAAGSVLVAMLGQAGEVWR